MDRYCDSISLATKIRHLSIGFDVGEMFSLPWLS